MEIMESDSTSTLTDESEAILENETTVLFDQDCHVSLNPIVDESLSTLTPKSQIDTSSNDISFKPHTYGKRHSILGTGKSNISAFRKPDLAELKEKYNRAKEKFKEWNLDKLWGGRVERMKRVSSVSLSNIVTAAFWIREGVPKTPCEVCKKIINFKGISIDCRKKLLPKANQIMLHYCNIIIKSHPCDHLFIILSIWSSFLYLHITLSNSRKFQTRKWLFRREQHRFQR